MRTIVFVLAFAAVFAAAPVLGGSTTVNGLYYRCRTAKGGLKVNKGEYLDFHANGRCGTRFLNTDGNGKPVYRTRLGSWLISGNIVEIAGSNGFTTFEVKGSRLVSDDCVYVCASSLAASQNKTAVKPVRKVARKK